MKILVVGAGGIGGYFGGRLSQENGMELYAALNSNLDLVKENGFNVKSIRGDFDYKFVDVFPNNQVCDTINFDVIILATKALKSIDQVKLLKNFIHSDNTSIIVIQNGLDTELEIIEAFPNNEVISAVAYIGVCKANGNQILHTGGEGVLQIGTTNMPKISEQISQIIDALKNQNVNASIVDSIRYKKYEKLLWNIPFNSISVIGGSILTDEMTDRAEVEELCENLMQEIIDIAKSDNITLPQSLISEKIEYTRNFPPYATSMLVDFQNGRKLEVDAILGNILDVANKNGIKAPHIKTIYALLKKINSKI